jgi:hypothetical protein
MKHAKKFLASLVLAALLTTPTKADLSWGYAGDLFDFDSNIQSGWLVQMYRDVGDNTSVSEITAFGMTGNPVGGNSSDDELLTGFTASTVEFIDEMFFGVSFAIGTWSPLFNAKVYTVLFDAATIDTATRAVVLDSAVYQLGGSDPHEYGVQPPVTNQWVDVIPEPGTMALLAMGMLGIGMWRRKIIA